ncbi:MAG: hypothetical protein AB7F43_10345 [Bacteriovoracia bacterium]
MDDSTHLNNITRFVTQHGLIGGILENLKFYYHKDTTILGFLRFSSWVFVSLIYLLPPKACYFLKLWIFFGVIVFSWKLFSRYFTEPFHKLCALLLLLSIRSIYDGLTIVWLNELNGVFFVSLGLFALGKEKEIKNFLAGLFCFVVALGFKPPFVWLLLGFSWYCYTKKQKHLAIVSGVLWLVFLSTSIYLSQTAPYSQAIYVFDPIRSVLSVVHILKHFAPILTGLVFFLFLAKTKKWTFNPLGVCMLGSGLLYAATMIPRGIRQGLGYYLSPALFMATIGLIILFSPAIRGLRAKHALGFLIIPLGLGLFAVSKGLYRDAAIRHVRDWAIEMNVKGKTPIIGVNSYEATIRMNDILKLRTKGNWKGTFVDYSIETPERTDLDYYVIFKDQVTPRSVSSAKLIPSLRSPMLEVYSYQ